MENNVFDIRTGKQVVNAEPGPCNYYVNETFDEVLSYGSRLRNAVVLFELDNGQLGYVHTPQTVGHLKQKMVAFEEIIDELSDEGYL